MNYSYKQRGLLKTKAYDLSIIDIMILKTILRYTVPTIRFKVLEDLNTEMNEDYQLTPTKFYYSLNKLVSKGFLEVYEGEKKRAEKVLITTEGKSIIQSIISSFVLSLVDYKEIIGDLVKNFMKHLGITKVAGNSLVILPELEDLLDASKLDPLAQYMDKSYVLATKEQFQHYRARNPSSIFEHTELIENRIREADNYFQNVIYIGYEIELRSKTRRITLEELKRVTSDKGLIILSSYEEFNNIDHFLLNPIIEVIQQTPIYFAIKKQAFESLFESSNFIDKGIYQHKGFLLGWGIVNKK